MSCDNLKSLIDMLLVVDSFSEKPNGKLPNVQIFLEHFRSKCKNLLQPYQNIATEDRLVKSKDRCDIRQYIANKLVKFGLKLWVCHTV